MPIKVYGASKLHHYRLWFQLKEEWAPEIDLIARWPKFHVEGVADTPENAKTFWIEDEEDVWRSDVVMVYATSVDVLRGALVEVGMGLALGKSVLAVGHNEGYGTWQYHPNVSWCGSLPEARQILLEWNSSLK